MKTEQFSLNGPFEGVNEQVIGKKRYIWKLDLKCSILGFGFTQIEFKLNEIMAVEVELEDAAQLN